MRSTSLRVWEIGEVPIWYPVQSLMVQRVRFSKQKRKMALNPRLHSKVETSFCLNWVPQEMHTPGVWKWCEDHKTVFLFHSLKELSGAFYVFVTMLKLCSELDSGSSHREYGLTTRLCSLPLLHSKQRTSLKSKDTCFCMEIQEC